MDGELRRAHIRRERGGGELGAAIIEFAVTIALIALIAALTLPRLGSSISSTFLKADDTVPGGGSESGF